MSSSVAAAAAVSDAAAAAVWAPLSPPPPLPPSLPPISQLWRVESPPAASVYRSVMAAPSHHAIQLPPLPALKAVHHSPQMQFRHVESQPLLHSIHPPHNHHQYQQQQQQSYQPYQALPHQQHHYNQHQQQHLAPHRPASPAPSTSSSTTRSDNHPTTTTTTTTTTATTKELQRKKSHKAIEKRRRERINDKISILRSMIPALMDDVAANKLTVLQGAIDLIRDLRRRVESEKEVVGGALVLLSKGVRA